MIGTGRVAVKHPTRCDRDRSGQELPSRREGLRVLVALRGGSSLGSSARVALCLAHSLLFTDLNYEASWTDEVSPPFDPVIVLDASVSSRAAVPVSDVRGSLTFDIGEHVSVGVFALVSVWYDLPLAREFFGPLAKWTEPRSTLVFASVGLIVKVRF